MKRTLYIILILILFFSRAILAQSESQMLYHFKFLISDKSELNYITQIISIDNVINDTVYAYANSAEFARFQSLNIAYNLISDTKSTKALSMASVLSEMASWDKYPSYELYEEMMQDFVNRFPELCVLEEMGTLQSGRKLLAIKISDFPLLNNESEPEVMLTSSIHGDETGGYIVLMRLIDHLLTSYNSENTSINTSQLLNNCEIWINPLANPNGTYKGGNTTLIGATRYNANNIDLNRNFPDPALGDHPDGNSYQEETLHMMAFAQKHNFSMAMNIHSGAEVVNYPWDTWSRLAADDAWWKYVGGNYRDSAQANSESGYLEDLSNGLTNGYDWYRITGGRQDYMNYFQHCREFTLEISSTKLYPSEKLPILWEANKNALLGYISESRYGIHGYVKNEKGQAISAKIEILNHDIDNSEVYSDSTNGFFTRYLKAGTYSLKISADSFIESVMDTIIVVDGEQTQITSTLIKIPSKICMDTSIIKKTYSSIIDSIGIPITNCGQWIQNVHLQIEHAELYSWITLETAELTINPQQEKRGVISLKNIPNKDTVFNFNIIVETDTLIRIPVTISVTSENRIICHRSLINHTLFTGALLIDSFSIENLSNYTQIISSNSNSETWLQVLDDEIALQAYESNYVKYAINTTYLPIGFYSGFIEFSNETKLIIPFNLMVDSLATLQIYNFNKSIIVNKNNVFVDTFFIENTGGGTLEYELEIKDESLLSKIEIYPSVGFVQKGATQEIILIVDSEKINLGNYNAILSLTSNSKNIDLPLNITIDTLAKLFVSTDTLQIEAVGKGIFKDSILVKNVGGNKLFVSATEKPTQGYKLIELPEKLISISAQSTSFIPLAIDANELSAGNYLSSVTINDAIIPVAFNLYSLPELSMNKNFVTLDVVENSVITDTLFLTNSGGSKLKYFIENDSQIEWIKTTTHMGEINPGETFPLIISINSHAINPQLYGAKLTIHSNETTRLPIKVRVLPAK